MTQRMQGDRFSDARGVYGRLEQEIDLGLRDGGTGMRAVEQISGWTVFFEIGTQYKQECRGQCHITVLTTFTLLDVDQHASTVNIGDFDLTGFTKTQAAGIN